MELNEKVSEEQPTTGGSSPAAPQRPHENGHSTKAIQILDACRRKDVDGLRALSTSDGGLVSDDVRCHACWFRREISHLFQTDEVIGPLLLGCDDQDDADKPEVSEKHDWKVLPKHVDEDQVQLDVDRSFIYYPTGMSCLSSHITMQLTQSNRPNPEGDQPTKGGAL